MQITVNPEKNATVLSLSGDFITDDDRVTLRDHVIALIEEKKIRVVIDFSGVEYINSSGLGALVSVLIKLARVNGDLSLACIGPNVDKVVNLTRLNIIFNVYPTVQSALAKFS